MIEKEVNGMRFQLTEGGTDEELAVVNIYKERVSIIAEYLAKDEIIRTFFGNLSKDDIAVGLNEPSVRIIGDGGVLTYCNHSFDDIHIIDLEFGGILENFYQVSIDG